MTSRPHIWMTIVFLFPWVSYATSDDNFDKLKPGSAPIGWNCGVTGGGVPKWIVEKDTDAVSAPNILKQAGEADFPWCIRKAVELAKGTVEVHFKALSGQEDQAGGVVWRWKDANNYYIARANVLEDNIAVYHTKNGTRQTLKNIDMKVTGKEWHSLKVIFQNTKYTVFYDSKLVLEGSDEGLSEAGGVGVWTKADSVVAFDNFKASESVEK